MAEYSRTGYWLIDREAEEGKEPLKIEDERPEHNSGCTDLKFIPMYDDSTFPYVISRNKFKIDLIDLTEHRIHTFYEDQNSTTMTSKLQLRTTKHLEGHGIDIYYNC